MTFNSTANPFRREPRRTNRIALYGVVVVALVVLVAPVFDGEGAGISREQSIELRTLPFRGKSPEYIAKFFVHPNGHAANAAMLAMQTEHGKQAIPLLTKLLKDDHPIMRFSAVQVLGDILMPKPEKRRRSEEPSQVTPEIEQLVKLIEPLSNDMHPAVNQAVSQKFLELGVETPATRRMAIQMANSPDLNTRTKALEIGQRVISDPDTQVKIGMAVSVHVNIPAVWGRAHGLIAKHKDDSVCRQAIPTLAHFLRNVANTRPVRGMFSDSPQSAALQTLDAQWCDEVEKMKDTVPGVCCAFVRLPVGWMESRKFSLDILKKMSPAAAPTIKAYVKSERQWLKEVNDILMIQLGGSDIAKTKADFNLAIDYLQYIAECLEADKPITKKCPIQIEEPKLYEDKVPEVGEPNLEVDLE